MSDFNENQIDTINEFRERVSDIIESEYEKTEAYLSKWLIPNNFNLNVAEKTFRNHKNWRQEKGIDGILDEDMSEIEEMFPFAVAGFDKVGRPLLFMKIGGCNLKEALDNGGRDKLIRYTVKQFETAAVLCKRQHARTSGEAHEFVGIVDMEGFSFRHVTSTSVASTAIELAKTLEAHYPSTATKIYIVNAPKVIKVLLSAVKPFLSTDSASRVKIFGTNMEQWEAVLLEHIEPDQLPKISRRNEILAQ